MENIRLILFILIGFLCVDLPLFIDIEKCKRKVDEFEKRLGSSDSYEN